MKHVDVNNGRLGNGYPLGFQDIVEVQNFVFGVKEAMVKRFSMSGPQTEVCNVRTWWPDIATLLLGLADRAKKTEIRAYALERCQFADRIGAFPRIVGVVSLDGAGGMGRPEESLIGGRSI
jgi:hypothetical protein